MPTTFLCPHCEAKLQSNNPQIQGKRVRCAKCNSLFTVTAGLIVRDAPVRTSTAARPEPEEEPTQLAPAKKPITAKRKNKKSSSSSTMYWVRTFIALALLIILVTATLVILINKGYLQLGD
ncbi:MAG: hypothetical protein RMI91_03190 [Gemmatales bacterium]|nr:hypothetical protein [Gemmatales bacterium]MDW7993635.1 hypothetical protein [Gemmatales bacterium]